MITLSDVAGLVLAGGQGRRMQRPGQPCSEKGLVPLHGEPLIAWSVRAMPEDLAHVYVSANRDPERYARYGTVVADDPVFGSGLGPLAGIASVLQVMTTPWLYVVPADVPRPPDCLLEHFIRHASEHDCELVYARTDRPQPLFMLIHKNRLKGLVDYLNAGFRQVQKWQRDQGDAVYFDALDADFFNINTPDDLQTAHRLIRPDH